MPHGSSLVLAGRTSLEPPCSALVDGLPCHDVWFKIDARKPHRMRCLTHGHVRLSPMGKQQLTSTARMV